jgi:hypothetical protein
MKEVIKINKMILKNKSEELSSFFSERNQKDITLCFSYLEEFKPIQYAIIHGHIEVIEITLKYKIHITEEHFILAATHNQLSILKLFLNYSTFDTRAISSAMAAAVKYGHNESLEIIMNFLQINYTNFDFSFLVYSIKLGHQDIFENILNHESIIKEVELKNEKLLTSIHHCFEEAITLNNINAVKILIKYQIDIKSFRNYPLIQSILNNHTEIALLILSGYNYFNLKLLNEILKKSSKNKNDILISKIWNIEQNKELFKEENIDIYNKYIVKDKINNFI